MEQLEALLTEFDKERTVARERRWVCGWLFLFVFCFLWGVVAVYVLTGMFHSGLAIMFSVLSIGSGVFYLINTAYYRKMVFYGKILSIFKEVANARH